MAGACALQSLYCREDPTRSDSARGLWSRGVEGQTMTDFHERRRGWGGSRWVESAGKDIFTAIRYFRLNRGFFAVAVVTLALGIGASTAVFSVAETLLLRPLSYPESDRLVTFAQRRRVERLPVYARGAGGACRLAEEGIIVRGDYGVPPDERRCDRRRGKRPTQRTSRHTGVLRRVRRPLSSDVPFALPRTRAPCALLNRRQPERWLCSATASGGGFSKRMKGS